MDLGDQQLAWAELHNDQYWIDKIMDCLNQTIFPYELCGLCPYISCSCLRLVRPSSQGSYTSCTARTGYRPCRAQKNENMGPLLKSQNFKMVTGNLSQAWGPLSMGSLCGCSGHVPMKLALCIPLCDEALNVWANCLWVVFLRVYLKTPSLRTGSFPVKSDFPTFPGSELRLTLMMNQKFLFLFCQKQLGVTTTKELFWLNMGIEIWFYKCFFSWLY